MRPTALCVLASLALAGAEQSAQTPPPPQQRPTFRSGVRTVMVPVSVTDEAGRFVRDLTQADFEIRDNDVPQPITLFQRDVQPITAVVLIDASASMLRSLTPVIASVNEFIVRLMPGDRARLGSFSEHVQLGSAFTSDRDELLEQLENEFNIRIGRRTRLWDALDEAIRALSTAEGRRVVIVVTDGIDTWSMRTLTDVQAAARRHNVAIYPVRFRTASREGQLMELRRGPDGSDAGRLDRHGPGALVTLARDTGGGFMQIEEVNGWQPPFTAISLDLHSQYVLGFTPAALDDRVHRLSVKVKDGTLKVRARQTYVAEAR